mmetsp:Transcript_60467/g.128168  ORF Transcript_60467/g.128168 Transcript_60467/m.128168 type:complete len:672 (+) Transcript_60467:176-2191(+)|eukprot:CAMPEP_0206427962 /NCGR_PEP_ID=MMETSP0324_2-20121206/5361_1 /ASSEMBLY_ACC=CAM_ASM_000836 /TAXON_ID=2866 /ORGANISM="Crypthecodinium cohnii, Strain Seligo" /LENGTH=671 /DNA_ID=CAMNT_0053893359 /DNA_START=101 /DNA_END=2116 /DNA_ORIENTATION=+
MDPLTESFVFQHPIGTLLSPRGFGGRDDVKELLDRVLAEHKRQVAMLEHQLAKKAPHLIKGSSVTFPATLLQQPQPVHSEAISRNDETAADADTEVHSSFGELITMQDSHSILKSEGENRAFTPASTLTTRREEKSSDIAWRKSTSFASFANSNGSSSSLRSGKLPLRPKLRGVAERVLTERSRTMEFEYSIPEQTDAPWRTFEKKTLNFEDADLSPKQTDGHIDDEPSAEKSGAVRISCRTHSSVSGHHKGSIAGILSKETKKEHPWVQFLLGPFDKLITFLILTNIGVLFARLQCEGIMAGHRAGFTEQILSDHLLQGFDVMEHVYAITFAIEVVVRLSILRRNFLFSKKGDWEWSNIFDSILALLVLLDLYVVSHVELPLQVLRPLRFLRLLRTLRAARHIKALTKLNVLINTVVVSFMALIWSIALLTIVMVLAALFLCQALVPSIEDPALTVETQEWIFRMYGTTFRSLYTVFELTFSGGWPNYVRPLVEEVGVFYALFFCVYIVMVTFAMFRIITALFLRDTMALASSDAETAVQDQIKQRETYAIQLLEFFNAADESQDGSLTLEEFEQFLEDERVRAWLSVMDLDVHETQAFFDTLAGGDGVVDQEDFVEGILQMKGAARSQEVVTILKLTQKMAANVASMKATLDRSFAAGDTDQTLESQVV